MALFTVMLTMHQTCWKEYEKVLNPLLASVQFDLKRITTIYVFFKHPVDNLQRHLSRKNLLAMLKVLFHSTSHSVLIPHSKPPGQLQMSGWSVCISIYIILLQEMSKHMILLKCFFKKRFAAFAIISVLFLALKTGDRKEFIQYFILTDMKTINQVKQS